MKYVAPSDFQRALDTRSARRQPQDCVLPVRRELLLVTVSLPHEQAQTHWLLGPFAGRVERDSTVSRPNFCPVKSMSLIYMFISDHRLSVG